MPSKDALKDAVLNAEKIYKQLFDYVIEIPAIFTSENLKVDIDKIKILFLNKLDTSVISFTRVFIINIH